MIDTATAADRIRSFILEKFPIARRKGLTNGDPLLDSGIIDSLGVLDLVAFIEKEFGVSMSDDELVPENFHNVDALVAFIQAKSPNTIGPRL